MKTIDYLRENIDYTNVKPNVSQQEMESFCKIALRNHVKTIYVPPVFVDLAFSMVGKDGIEVGTTAGFPYGNVPVELKELGIRYAAEHKARWVDVCLNVSLVRSNRFDEVKDELLRLVAAACDYEIGLKTIIEAPYLGIDELVETTKLVDSCGVDYLKTATGVGTKVSERGVEVIKLLLKRSKLKVAGGISTLSEAERFFDLGADKIGSSNGFQILEEAKTNEANNL